MNEITSMTPNEVRPKILIIGHARHGKDTVAEMLRDNYNLSFASSSEFVGKRAIWPMWGKERYETFEQMFEDRVNHRELWSNLINAYCTPDKSRTGREMIKEEGLDMYVGMRNRGEFESCMANEIFDLVVWVDASGRLPPEDNPKMELVKHDAKIVIDNNQGLVELEQNVAKLVKLLNNAGYKWRLPVQTTIPTSPVVAVEDAPIDMLEKPEGAIDVLDHGYVVLVDYHGSDDAIAEAARLSYGRGTKKARDNSGLINYLYGNAHTSPFEMAGIKVQMRLPIFVMRQLIRHRTAHVNEYSGRYSEMPRLFYIPDIEQICHQHATNKQGSGELMDHHDADLIQSIMRNASNRAFDDYENLLGKKVARETAREILPLNTYTEVMWQMDMNNMLKFLWLRDDPHSQWEIREFAKVLDQLVQEAFPLTHAAYKRKRSMISLTPDGLEALFTGNFEKITSTSERAQIEKIQRDMQERMTAEYARTSVS